MPHGKNTVLQTGNCLSSILPYNIVIVIATCLKTSNKQSTNIAPTNAYMYIIW